MSNRPEASVKGAVHRQAKDSNPSTTSRMTSASEASRAIDTEARRKGKPVVLRRVGKEGRTEGILQNVRVQSTLSHLSATTGSALPTQHTSSRLNLSNPLIPNRSIPSNQQASRLTLRPQRQDQPISRSGPSRDQPDQAANQTSDPQAIDIRAILATAKPPKPFVPRQKIKQLYTTTSSSKSGKKKDKAVAGAAPPSLRLQEPEEGDWEGGGHDWIQKSVSPVEPAAETAREVEVLVASSAEPVEAQPPATSQSHIEKRAETNETPAAAPVPQHPSSNKLPPSAPRRNRTISVTSRPNEQVNNLPARTSINQPPLFLPGGSDDDGLRGPDVFLPRGNQGNPARSESPAPDPLPRSHTRRETRYEVSPDTQEVAEASPPGSNLPRTSSTQVSPSRPSDRNKRTSRSVSTSHHSQRLNIDDDDDFTFAPPDEQPQVDQSSSRTRSGPSPIKTYGAKARSMIPPPPSKRSKKDEKRSRKDRDSRSRARVRDGGNIQALARGVRIGSSARPDIRLPVSDIRGSSDPSSRRLHSSFNDIHQHADDEEAFNDQPKPNSLRRREIIPDNEVQTSDQEMDIQEDESDNGDVAPRRIRPEDVNTPGADILNTDCQDQEEEGEEEMDDEYEDQEEEDDDEEDERKWSRKIPWDLTSSRTRQSDKTRRTQERHRKSRRGPTDGYRYLAHKFDLTPINDTSEGDPRRNAKRKVLEEDYADMREEDERKRRKKNRHREEKKFWTNTIVLRAPGQVFYEHDLDENPRLQPMSKHGDPAIKDRERQMTENLLYVARGRAVDYTGRVWAHDNRPRRERASMLIPRLKMSRGKSSDTRAKTEKYVSIISEHSRSSRAIRRPPGRYAVSRIDNIPEYLVKPIKTVSWDDYNHSYDETRAFPIDTQLLRRGMADLRAQALRPAQGRNRLRNTKTGVRRDAEVRRRDRRILDMEDLEDRVDTFTPSQHPMDLESGNTRPIARRAPKLNFTTRSPTPPPPARAQKKKISTLLQSAEKDGEDTTEADNADVWENEVRPDPIAPADFFDESSQVPQVRPNNRTRKLSTSTTSGTGNPILPITSPGRGLPPGDEARNVLSKETGARVTDPKRTWPPLAAKSVPLPHPPADEIDSDFPSVPTASELLSRPSRPSRPSDPKSRDSESTVGPTTTDSTTTSKMLSGTGFTESLMEAILKTKEMFAEPAKESPPTGGVRGAHPPSRPKLRQPRITEAVARQKDMESSASTTERTKEKGKGRDPRERPNIIKLPSRISTDSSDLPTPALKAYKARATQQSSSRIDFDTGENGALPPASAKVIVRPPAVSSPMAGYTGSAPRIGLQRTKTSAAPTQISLKTPLMVGKSMASLKSQFKTPTQSSPIRPTTTPRRPLAETTQHYHPSSDAEDDHDHTLHIDAGQYMPSPTQANTIYTEHSRGTWGGKNIPSHARASTTAKDSSSNPTPNASMATSSRSGFNLSSSTQSRSLGHLRMAPTQFADMLYPHDSPTPVKEKTISTPSTSGKFVPVNPKSILRGKSSMAGYPMQSALKKGTRTQGEGQIAIAGPSNDEARNNSGQLGGKGFQRGREGGGQSGSGVNMERIRSERAKQPFRAPSRVLQEKDMSSSQSEWI